MLRIVVILGLFSLIKQVAGSADEEKLFAHLFDESRYNSRIRPVAHNNETVNVVLDMVLYQLMGINEKAEYIEVSAWMIQKWEDSKLRLVWIPVFLCFYGNHDCE